MDFQQKTTNSTATKLLLWQAAWLVVGALLVVLCIIYGINFTVPFLVLISAWFFKIGLQARSDWRALERSLQSNFDHDEFENGQWVAVQGVARVLIPGADNLFPNVLAYYYRVSDLESGSPRRSTSASLSKRMASCRFDGFYLVAMGLSTNKGVVKLYGFPDMTNLTTSSIPENISARGELKAQIDSKWLPSYLQRANVVGAVTQQVDTVLKYGDREQEGDSASEYMCLQGGDKVCIFGRWEEGKLIADKHRPRGLPVYKDSLDVLVQELKSDALAFLIAGCVFAAIVLALVGWSLW